MPKLTAIVHTLNDGLRLGRALDSLRGCDELLIIDHGSTDNTGEIARQHGASVKQGIAGVDRGAYALDAGNDWILCLLANEALNEELEASLHVWKEKDHDDAVCFSIAIREEKDSGWQNGTTETRLVNRKKLNWTSETPPNFEGSATLPGHLLRFKNP